jgi:hypothetical protein
MKYYTIIILFASVCLNAQNSEIQIGTGLAHIYDHSKPFPNSTKPPSNDNEVFLTYLYFAKITHKINFLFGAGYSFTTSDYQQTNGWVWTYGPFIKYNQHQLNIPFGVDVNIINRKSLKAGICGYLYYNTFFYKQLITSELPQAIPDNKIKISPASFESFATTYCSINRMKCSFSYRIAYAKFRDNAIGEPQKSIDFYNPWKIRFSVGYLFNFAKR